MAALRYALPDVPAGHSDNVMAEIRVLGQRAVLSALALTVLGSSAMFTVFTYIAPILHEQTHASTGFVSAMLMLFGVGMTIGNLWSGKATDRAPDRTLIVTLVALTVILLGFA